MTATGALATAGAAAVTTAAVRGLHRTGRLPGGSARWERTNHTGATVTLTDGVALAAGATVPLVLVDPPAALATAGAALAGAVDDLTGSATAAKGLRGHLRALAAGEPTTGVLKVAALAGSGLLACAWSDHRDGRGMTSSTLAGAALVAGAANLANLFDLRPGRALKVFLALGAPLAVEGRPAAGAVLGGGLVVLRDDLRGASMLGDTGANPLGAAVGLAAAQALGGRGRATALAAVVALTLASERVSFTRVIESTPVLRELDRWGRPT
ncbi:hypothetical protein GCM10011509_23300 [Ornithinimicrobium pekingense]|uniref:UDP-N-acetylmuramyl pentapeptide phosphotransferase n=1 Tax=Ornithinimicrobium pekingense TaxID=384677 RepID=A0ABQ2FA18_9MICO|nr:hypothetical protein GCM10011509_23300 [Ornithinimicrobium pekingense]